MKNLKYSEILARNRELEERLDGSPYRIALLSNIVIAQLKDMLEYVLRLQGIKAEIILGEYDNIVQDSARLNACDAVLIFWEAANLLEGLHVTAATMDAERLGALRQRVEGEMSLVFENLKATPLVLINSFSSLVFSSSELREGPLQFLCESLNQRLAAQVSATRIVVNLDAVLAMAGLEHAVDFRQFQSSKALYSVDFLKRYAAHVAPAFRAACGRIRKVLVLDCDNTLWGGILGEDGDAGLEMNDGNRRGKVFREVQRQFLSLKKQGVLLALCSKNNPEDVRKVLCEHPDMLLREEDVVAQKVNWRDKASNIRELAGELGLGLDSFVFLDDSPFELGLVQKELPEVICYQVPAVLSEYPALVRQLSQEFFTLSVAQEDAEKTRMYQQEQQRKESAASFSSVEDYLRSLRMEISLAWNAAVPVARASQMTQKTNQFNLTTRRYTEADIQRMLEDGRYQIGVISVSDRYGDYGVTGLVIIEANKAGGEARIDTMLLSCRVLGRNVEQAFMDHLLGHLRTMGYGVVSAEYLKTAKNAQVENFYDKLGFSLEAAQEQRRMYRQDTAQYRPANIDYIKVIADGS